MKLFIDTSNSEKIIIALDGKKYETAARQNKSQKLLSFIDEKLKEAELAATDLTQIEVATGPGSFTGLRVGISVANTLGWALSIPVNGSSLLVDVNY